MSTETRGAAAPDNDLAPETDILWVFKLSPELGDGAHFELAEDIDVVLGQVRLWLQEAKEGGFGPGESFTVEIGQTTRAEFNALPEL